MKVKASKYLHDIKPILLRLRDRLLEEFPYASILATDSQAKQYSVSRTATNIGMVGLWSGRGFVVKVYDGSGYGEYSFNEISEDRVEEIIAKVKGDLIPMSGHLPEGVERSVYAMLEDEPLVFADSTEYEIDPAEYGDEKIIRELTRISETGRAHDERILDCGAFLNYQKYSKLFLSRNRDMEQNVLWTAGGFSVMASRGQEIKRSYKGFSNLGGAELLERMRDGVRDAAKVTLELLESETITPGEYDCICTPEATGMIVHEAFGHGVEMDMFVKKRALAEQFVGKR